MSDRIEHATNNERFIIINVATAAKRNAFLNLSENSDWQETLYKIR